MWIKKHLIWIVPLAVGLILGFFFGYAQNPVMRAIRVAESLGASEREEDKKRALEMLHEQKDLIRLATINARVENARRIIALSLADRLIAQRMWREALNYLSIGRDIMPGSTGIAYREGLVHYNIAYTTTVPAERTQHAQKAEERLRFVVKQEPDNPDALYILALMALQERNAQLSYRYVSHAHRVNPRNVDILFLLARVHFELGEYDESKRVYGRLQSILPRNDARWDQVEKNIQILSEQR